MRHAVKGTLTEKKRRPDTLNLRPRVELALQHLSELANPSFNNIPHTGFNFAVRPPEFGLFRWSWVEINPYPVLGFLVGRYITGSHAGWEVELDQRRNVLRSFDNLDGFSWVPRSAFSKRGFDLWEQRQSLNALVACFAENEDERLAEYIEDLIDALWGLAERGRDGHSFPETLVGNSDFPFSNGTLIEPLTKYWELSGNERALDLAAGLSKGVFGRQERLFNGDGSFTGFFRGVLAVLSGLTRFAVTTGDKTLVDRARGAYRFAASRGTSYGSTPDFGQFCEPCSIMELINCALQLARAGHPEYWDDVDRMLRNHLTESQFLDLGMYDEERDGLRPAEQRWYRDYRDIPRRSIGGFPMTLPNAFEWTGIGSAPTCCTGHSLWGIHHAWEHIVTQDRLGIHVNLSLNYENGSCEVIGYEPYFGRTSVIPKVKGTFSVRIPLWAKPGDVTARVGGRDVIPDIDSGRVWFREADPNAELTLLYPLRRAETEESVIVDGGCRESSFDIGVHRYRAAWRGNTVIRVTPAGDPKKGMYRREHMDTDEVPYAELQHFIPEREFHW